MTETSAARRWSLCPMVWLMATALMLAGCSSLADEADSDTVDQPESTDLSPTTEAACSASECETETTTPDLPLLAADPAASDEPLVWFYTAVVIASVDPDRFDLEQQACMFTAGHELIDDVDAEGFLAAPTLAESATSLGLDAAAAESVAALFTFWNERCLSTDLSPDEVYATDMLGGIATCATRSLGRDDLLILGATSVDAESRDDMIDTTRRRTETCGGAEAEASWLTLVQRIPVP